ncbi:hypothetical protein HDU99_000812 [Rhizoclosmatium hyalinum]|nr:hypothetical protein HDU99_000812 [Rhizoclosmatium hyalinum]
MTVPESLDHQEANIRQLLVGYLRTANRESVAFVNFGYSLVDAFAMMQWPEMAARIEEIRVETGCNQMTARITAGYLEGEFCVLKAEMTNTALCKGPKTFSILPGTNTTQECLQSTSGKENIVLPFILNACTPKDLIDCISRNPSLRVLNLIGAHESVTDDVLLALVKYCPNLEQLTFGQDNIHLPPLNVSSSTLKTLVSSCKKLKFLRICHPCQEGGDPSDPTGELCHMLNQNGFVQQFIPNPESCRDSLVKHPYQFWRRTVEESYCSAVWYERAI